MKGMLKVLFLVLIVICLAAIKGYTFPKAYPVSTPSTNMVLTRADSKGGWYVAVINFGAATDTTYNVGFDFTEASIQGGTQALQYQWLGDPNDKLEDPKGFVRYSQTIANPRAGQARVSMPLMPLAAAASTDYKSSAHARFIRIAGAGAAGSCTLFVAG